ncbi:MAG: SpoIIE family protein phosphatase [Oscillatoriaceae cyanobacterium Prado104]|jgi:two-component system sensor histidine kinase ChiS|nr:SpoIIE family protein phosphatase [Oscillatoriaceae cyanobacterium Prado104]
MFSKWLRSGIGVKLASVFSIGIATSIFIQTNVSIRAVKEFGELSASKNETSIREQLSYFLPEITREQAERYGEVFQQFARLTSLTAYQAQSYLDNINIYGQQNLNISESFRFDDRKEIFTNSAVDRVSVNYWELPTISPEITAQINALSHIDPLLEKAQKSNPSAVASWVLMESTLIRYYPNAPLIKFLPPKQQDTLKNGIFYTIATPKNNPNRKTLWTEVYQDPGGQGLMTSVTTPIYSRTGQFLGVAGIDVTLDNIVKEILGKETLAIDPQNPEGKSDRSSTLKGAFSFLIDRAGNIIALPLDRLSLIGIQPKSDKVKSNQLLEYSLLNSSEPKVREIARKMVEGKNRVDRLLLQGKPYIISFHPISSTEWSLGIVIPEASLLSSVEVTRNTLSSTVQNLNYRLGLTTIELLIGSTTIILLVARSIVKPLIGLTREVSQVVSSDESGSLIAKIEQIHPESINTNTQEILELKEAFVKLKNSLITNWKQLEENNEEMQALNDDLQRLDQLKDEFLANTSHELRTPLNGIIGIADSLIDGVTGQLSPATISNLSMIAASGRRLSNLVNDILDFSKLKNTNLELQLQPVGMREIADLVLTISRSLIGQKDLVLINAIDPSLHLACADENRVQQILQNLVGNAIKFTERGTIEICARSIPSLVPPSQSTSRMSLAITVSDTGIGIDEDKFDSIFESFEQADGSTARQYGGTGLGLAITKKLVELHGGQISVASTLGVGSQFTFTLPAWESDGSIVPPTQILSEAVNLNDRAPGLKASSRNDRDIFPQNLSQNLSQNCNNEPDKYNNVTFKILIVDDDPINLQVLVNNLSLQNYAVTQATNGQEALEIIEKGFKPDLIILDVMMPRMTGYEVTQKLRARFPAIDLPILLLTAKTQVSDLIKGLNVGANDYLSKPIAKDELLARIETHLNMRQLKVENLRLSAELDVVKKLQQMVLPKQSELDAIVGLDLAGYMEPADEVGGDYYDILQQDGQLKISIGDVTGHGLESGLLMIMAQTAVRTLQKMNETDPVKFLDVLNQTLYDNLQRMESDRNMTLAILDYAGGVLKLSGQHEEAIVVRADGTLECIDTMDLGFPIGLVDEIGEFIAQTEVQLNPGDVVALYTDGIPEAFDINKKQYGLNRLREAIVKNRHLSAQEIREAAIEDLQQYIGTQKVFDDITLVVMKQK